jgi:hypothetical protein
LVEIINIFDIFFIGVNVMDDSSTLKQGSYFAIGIGIIVFLLGIGAYIYF